MTLADLLQVHDVRTDAGHVLASMRFDYRYGWHVRVAPQSFIYLASEADAVACLNAVREAQS